MADTKYIYRGPVSGVTLVTGEGADRKERDVQFFDGQTVEVPADHPHIICLVAQGRLVAPPAKTEDKATKPTGKTTTKEPA